MGSVDMSGMQLFRQLQSRGFQSVLYAPKSDSYLRVLVGPYFDEAAANKAKGDLQSASFRVLRKWE